MPTAIVVHLKTPRRPSPIHLRGWLYRVLTPHFPDLHRGQGPRPFSLATGMASSETSWARLSFLQDDLAAAALEVLWSKFGSTLPLGRNELPIIAIYERGHPLTGQKSWQDLLESTPSVDITLDFQTPTLFKKGAIHYPAPVPELIVSSLARHWSSYAPKPLTGELKDALLKKITLRFLNTRTITSHSHTLIPGFVGRTTLHLPKATEKESCWLARLGELAFFSGVGAKTTIGFGLTRRVAEDDEKARPHPNRRQNRKTHHKKS